MLKTNIDVSGLHSPNLTGVGVYIVNLIKALKDIDDLDLSASYKISRIKYRSIIQSRTSIPFNLPFIPLLYDILPKPYSLFHGPDYWIPVSKSIKKVVTIHDFSVFHEGLWSKGFADYGKMKLTQILEKHQPDHVIVVSDFVKGELIDRFPAYKNKVTTIYHGLNHFEKVLSNEKEFDFPYVLCVGTIEVRKNVLNLANSFEKISSLFPRVKLVFAGGNSGYRGVEIAEKIRKMKNVIHLDYVNNETMQNLIQNAMFVAYPSVYEGFGFPILEAMNVGVPILTSDFGAMKEVSGGKAFLANTLDINTLAESLEELLKNESLRNKLAAEGLKYVKEFTWQKCANETFKVYKNVLS